MARKTTTILALAYINSFYQTGLKNLLDVAVLEHGELKSELAVDKAYGKVDEIPFDFTRRRMSVIVDHEHETHQLICKGAVEEILAVCTFARDEDVVAELDGERRQDAKELVAELNEDGFRVVAVAYRDFPMTHGAYSVADESDLMLAGFIGFLDPPKESAAPALKALADQGVRVKILTGDNDLVSRKVCRDVGLAIEHIVLGSEIAGLDDKALGEIADKGIVFAKLTPDDKVRIVRALRARGHTVGFMGDGINDAGRPSRGRRRHFGGLGRGRRQGVGRHHPAREEPDGARGRRHRGAQDLRQHHQVHQDDGEFELREHVQRARRERVPAVPADAARSRC